MRAYLHQLRLAGHSGGYAARNVGLDLADQDMRFLIRDRDSKCSGPFERCSAARGIRIVKTPVRAPQANAIAEWFVRTVRAECLDWLLILNRRHLERVLRVTSSTTTRRGRIARSSSSHRNREEPPPTATIGETHRHDRLGGLIH